MFHVEEGFQLETSPVCLCIFFIWTLLPIFVFVLHKDPVQMNLESFSNKNFSDSFAETTSVV